MQRLVLFAAVMNLASCAKEERMPAAPAYESEAWKALTINEAVASGSQEVNEFGDRSDWIEIHNPGPRIHLAAGEWFVSDDVSEPMKFELPAQTIEEQGFVVIWCDGMDVTGQDVHTNFSLDGEGERLRLTRRVAGGPVAVDVIDIGAMQGAAVSSMGRFPDGTATWAPLSWPTPGGPNESGERP